MGKIHVEFDIAFDRGDIVVFKKNNILMVGYVDGYYIADSILWYNIRVNNRFVYTYTNGGDIPEHDILCKLNGHENIRRFIEEGDV